jgi:ParB family chromosome partitioning protein
VVRDLLEALPEENILTLLPDSAENLRSLASLGQDDLPAHLQAWQKAQAARLRHLQVQLTDGQLEVVQEAMELAMAGSIPDEGNPNQRGNALVAICRTYLASSGKTL